MADVTARMLALLTELQSGRDFTGAALAERLGVSPRTLRRDVERLRGYGYPVGTRPGPGGGYRLAAGTSLPPLLLDDEETLATLVGLAGIAATADPTTADGGSIGEAAARAYGKVDQYLPKRLRGRAERLRASLETKPVRAPQADAGVIGLVAEAIAGRRLLRFDYHRDGQVTERVIEPYRQIHQHLRWYLLGWDTDRQDWRVFRTDRIRTAVRLQTGFEVRELPAATATEYLQRGLDRERHRVVLSVQAAGAEVADAFSGQDISLLTSADRTEVVIMVDDWRWLLLSLVRLAAPFRFVDPAGFGPAISRFADRLSAAVDDHD